MIAALLPAGMPSGWLVDTLIATTLLCLVVLTIRRSVAHHFGPHIAYALWLIPALRMLLPPLPQIVALPSPFAVPPLEQGSAIAVAVPVDAPAPGLLDMGIALVGDNLAMLLLGLWLAGALVTLGWQALVHHRLARALTTAELVEIIGNVRVYRSDAVGGPLSFGLLDPVILLPADDRLMLNPAERALAIDHELTHHARGDLWANGAAVLFAALHWFNPLVRGAWRAFRFDQEAACDASVLARSDGKQRGVYARALAKTATGHPSAFASPMIGPDRLKERLAMLTRPDVSPLRRRLGAMLAATFLIGAMVATATPVLADHPEPPAAPAAPEPAQPPAPPAPPAFPDPIRVDERVSNLDIWNDNGRHVTRVRLTNGKTVVLRTERAPTQAEVDRMVAEAEASRIEADRTWGDAEAARGETEAARGAAEAARGEAERQRRIMLRESGRDSVTEATSAAVDIMVEARIGRELNRRLAARAASDAMRAARVRIRHAAVTADCDGRTAASDIAIGPEGDAATVERKTFRYVYCGGDGSLALHLSALREARTAMAAMEGNRNLTDEECDRALTELDREIASLEQQIAERNN